MTTSIQNSSEAINYLTSLSPSGTTKEDVISSIAKSLFKQDQTEAKIKLADQDITVTTETIPDFLKDLLGLATSAISDKEKLLAMIEKTVAMKPALSDEDFSNLIKKQLTSFFDAWDNAIREQENEISGAQMDSNEKKEAENKLLETVDTMSEEIINVLTNLAPNIEIIKFSAAKALPMIEKLTIFYNSIHEINEESKKTLQSFQKILQLVANGRPAARAMATIERGELTDVHLAAARQTAAKTNNTCWRILRGLGLVAAATSVLFVEKVNSVLSEYGVTPSYQTQFAYSAYVLGAQDLLSAIPITGKLMKSFQDYVPQIAALAVVAGSGVPLTPALGVEIGKGLMEIVVPGVGNFVYERLATKAPAFQNKYLCLVGRLSLTLAALVELEKLTNLTMPSVQTPTLSMPPESPPLPAAPTQAAAAPNATLSMPPESSTLATEAAKTEFHRVTFEEFEELLRKGELQKYSESLPPSAMGYLKEMIEKHNAAQTTAQTAAQTALPAPTAAPTLPSVKTFSPPVHIDESLLPSHCTPEQLEGIIAKGIAKESIGQYLQQLPKDEQTIFLKALEVHNIAVSKKAVEIAETTTKSATVATQTISQIAETTTKSTTAATPIISQTVQGPLSLKKTAEEYMKAKRAGHWWSSW